MCADHTGQTRIADLRQSGATKLVFPQTYRTDSEVILVNTAGGITGGDAFDLDLAVHSGATLTLTTQAAERAYRAQPDEVGQVAAHVHVSNGVTFNWLPQELILFEGSALNRRLQIDLETGANLLMSEALVFGRAAMHETLHDITFQDRLLITRNGVPLYLDGLNLEGDAAQKLARAATANGAKAMASVVLVRDDAAANLDAVRAALPATGGASMIAEDVLVIRFLASDSFELRRTLMPLLARLSPTPLPTAWRL